MRRTQAILGLIVGAFVAVGVRASERKIDRTDLPPAVERTVAAQSAGATVRGFSKEVDKGQTFYEAKLTVSGHSKDILIDANGSVVEVEEEVSLASLAASVQAGLKAGTASGTIKKVESITKNGRLVAYEAHVDTKGKRSEVQVGPDGKSPGHEE